MSKRPSMAAADASASGEPDINPFAPLLSLDRQQQLAAFTPDEQNVFFGRVMSSVFSSDAYQKLVFETAADEFDKIATARKSGTKQ
jgi:hypothetical protein